MAVQRIQLKRRITGLLRLPVSHAAVARAAEQWAVHEPVDSARIADTVFVDPCLAVTLLRARYLEPEPSERFPSPREIVSNLSPLQVRRIVAATAVGLMADRLSESNDHAFPDTLVARLDPAFDDLRKHALATAVCCRLLVQELPIFHGTPARLANTAYLAGLIHDLGKFVLLALARSENKTATLPPYVDEENWWRALEDRYVPHTLAGKWYAEALNLPASMVQVIGQHHLSPRDRDESEETRPLFTAIDLARRLLRFSDEKNDTPLRPSPRILKDFELGEQRFVDLVDTCRAATQAIIQSLSFTEGTEQIQLRAVLNVLETDIGLSPGHARALHRSVRLRALQRLYQSIRNRDSLEEIQRHIVDHIREELRLAPCICGIADQNGGQLLLHIWRSLEDTPHRTAVPLDTPIHDPEQTALVNALHALGLGVGADGWAGTALRDIANWGGIVAVPMLVRGTCYGQIIFDAAATPTPLTEEEFDDLLAFGSACGLLVLQQQERERMATAGERHLETAQREAELRRRLKAAERLADIGERSAHAVQALNTPLSLAVAQLEWFLNRSADERTRHALEPVLRHTRAASRSAKDLVLLTRPPQPRTEPTLINFVLHQAVAQMNETALQRGVRFVENYADGLPRVHADRRLLEHALTNLLVGGTETMTGKESTVTVQTWAGPDRQAVFARITHAVTGAPSPQKTDGFIAWADERFADTPSGMSLLVAREIIDAHGGTLEIETLPGGSCAFTVQLPAAAARAPRVVPQEKPPEKPRFCCLVVDDEPAVRDILAEALKTRDVDVIPASNGVEALQLMEKYPFDFLITDLQMPIMDGLGLLRTLRKQGNTIPVIMITGSQESDYIEESIGAGITAYIQKPFQLKNLFEHVDKLLENLAAQKS